MSVEPFADVERSQVLHEQRAVQIAEILQVAAIPLVGVRNLVLLRMVEEKVTHGGDAKRVGVGQLARSVGHQLVESFLGLLEVVAAFGQPNLLAIELDVPGVLGRAIPGLGGSTHGSNLLTLLRNTEGEPEDSIATLG